MNTTHVSLILADKVRLRNLTGKLCDKLVAAGFDVIPDGNGYSSVIYKPMEGNITLNQSLVNLLSCLAHEGVAFETDYKQTYPPSYAMQYLREHGCYEGDILSCGFNGKEWNYEQL